MTGLRPPALHARGGPGHSARGGYPLIWQAVRLGGRARRKPDDQLARVNLNVQRVLSLPYQSGDVDLDFTLKVPKAERKSFDGPCAHASHAEFNAEYPAADARVLPDLVQGFSKRINQLGCHLGTRLMLVVPDFDAAVFARLRSQGIRLHSMSPRAIALSSSQSAWLSGVGGPLDKPSSTSARNR